MTMNHVRSFKLAAGMLLALMLAMPAVCSADSFSWTDTTSGIPGTTYQLDISPNGCTTCSATLTVNTSGATGLNGNSWFIDWIQLKFDQGTNPDLSNLSAPSSNWNIADKVDQAAVSVLNPGGASFTIPSDGFSALYTSGILSGGTIDITQGLLVNGSNTYAFSFDFTFLDGSGLNATPSLKVGYYDGLKNNGSYRFTQMSQQFTTLPEPTSLALMGGGLIALVGLLRRRRSSRSE